jgi:DNA-binding MarR family transcriptional regulator
VKKPLHAPRQASAEAVLEFSVATIELYFRIEAITRAVGGFTEAGGEFGVMKSLVQEGPHTVPDIARARPISRQHCQTIVNHLAAKGLVEFLENPRHKRSPLVAMTKKGRKHFDEVRAIFLRASGAYAHHFTAADIDAATATLRHAREVLVV